MRGLLVRRSRCVVRHGETKNRSGWWVPKSHSVMTKRDVAKMTEKWSFVNVSTFKNRRHNDEQRERQ